MEKINSWDVIHYLENYKRKDNTELYDIFTKYRESKNELLVSELIDCLSKNNVFSDEIKMFVFNELNKSSHYLIKLSSLEYMFSNSNLINSSELNFVLKESLEQRNLSIVKNQILLNLIYLDHSNVDFYFEKLKKSLAHTKDYRAHVRLYNFLSNKDKNHVLAESKIKKLVEITAKFNFGKSVDNAIGNVPNLHL